MTLSTANKSLCAWGVEGRVPFLDKEFLDIASASTLKPKCVPGSVIEKKILLRGFRRCAPLGNSLAAEGTILRSGVGYSWIDTLKKVTAQADSDTEMANGRPPLPDQHASEQRRILLPYHLLRAFSSESAARSVPSVPSVACSTAEALAWDTAFKNMNDPSGRAVKGVHEAAY